MKKMVILLVLLISALFLTGCATTKIATDIGVIIGSSFQESAAKGEISAEQSIKAWPYVSGVIQGLLAENFDLEMPKLLTGIMKELDILATKESLTPKEKGYVIGYYVRLEKLGAEFGWDKYGVNLTSFVTKYVSW